MNAQSAEDRRGFANRQAARALVASLVAAGVRAAVVSPGSRSTPLVLAVDEEPSLDVFVATDERSAGFFALGAARESNRPVVLICTSGTAAANYLPSVVEASLSQVPLIVLTADRPPESRDAGAAQTIAQSGLYGAHVRWQSDLAPPEPAPAGSDSNYYGAIAARAAATALSAPRGPVHLNVPFREPLLPRPGSTDVESESAPPVPVRVHVAIERASDSVIAEAADRACAATRGAIVCGPSCGEAAFAAHAAELARLLGWPLLADPLSGARTEDFRDANLVDNYDLCLRSESFAGRMHPQVVLRFGALTSSKPLESWLAAAADSVIAVAPSRVWPDPSFRSRDVVWGDVAHTAAAIAARITRGEAAATRTDDGGGRARKRWTAAWLETSTAAAAALDKALSEVEEPFEGVIARRLTRALSDGDLLHVGNSMPVRDLDTYGGALPAGVRVGGNRGANGIDGVLSTAVGAAAVARGAAFLYLGDLSFLHDLSGLQLAARNGVALTVVVANNDGGGIFELLPQAELGARFERLFATPHGCELEPATAAAGGGFESVRDQAALDAALLRCRERGGLNVVEVKTDRKADALRRRTIVAGIVRSIDAGIEAAA